MTSKTTVFSVGDIVSIKTTGEKVTVLDFGEPNQIIVRRPLLTSDGITHLEEPFYTFELETLEQELERDAKNTLARMEVQKNIINKRIKELQREEEDETRVSPKVIDFKVN